MKKSFIRAILVFGFLFLLGALPSQVQAITTAGDGQSTSQSAGKENACAALKDLDSSKSCGTGITSVNSLIGSVINILSVIVGIAAVIMVIISGLKYITSGGDSGGISSAKTTLVYALVGLAIAALAQILVRFVLSNVG